jgi:hypothetical protein
VSLTVFKEAQGAIHAICSSTCWIKSGIGEATRRNWGPHYIAMPTMEFLGNNCH